MVATESERPRGRPTVGRRDTDAIRAHEGVESNARLTGLTAAVLLVLLAAEGITVVRVRPLLTAHVFIGMLLVPPIVVKIGSTGYRFVRYYAGAPAYRHKGPPPMLLRLLGPLVVLLTVVMFASGIALLFVGLPSRANVLFIHKASFVLWFGAMTLHVLGHFLDTVRLAPRDFVRHTRDETRGAALRQWTLAGSLVVGILLAALLVGKVGIYVGG